MSDVPQPRVVVMIVREADEGDWFITPDRCVVMRLGGRWVELHTDAKKQSREVLEEWWAKTCGVRYETLW